MLTYFGAAGIAWGFLAYFFPKDQQENPAPAVVPKDQPQLVATTFSRTQLAVNQSTALVLHIKNISTSPLATAKNIYASIGYKSEAGQGMHADYGAFVENSPQINIGRGQTKRLIFMVAEDGKIYAVTFTGPRNDFQPPTLETIGELTPGQWSMSVMLNAENYTKIIYGILTIDADRSVEYQPTKERAW